MNSEQSSKHRIAVIPYSRVYTVEADTLSNLTIRLRYSFTIKMQQCDIQEGELTKIVEDIKRKCSFKSSHVFKVTYEYENDCHLDPMRLQLLDQVLPATHKLRMEADLQTHHEFLLTNKKRNPDLLSLEIIQNALEDNKDHQLKFRVCSTYPASFLLPHHVANAAYASKLQEMIDFREKQRIPVICYVHSEPSGRISSLWRSGQLKTGMLGVRNTVDEEMISYIGKICFQGNPNSRCQIFDCRPYLNAVGNKIMGKGYLNPDNYHINDVHFGNIANIHVMRKGLEGLLSGYESGKEPGSTNWIGHLHSILSGATFVRDKILEGTSVIVNCSDGWDRTPQIICLTKIMLEPYFRTIEGFQTLIHYEWNCFGHKFKSRQYFLDSSEASPVFIQFLDCVNHIRTQFPEKFEFNESLLIVLAKAIIENCFIEFNFDNTEQYLDHDSTMKVPELSIWRLIYASLGHFVNQGYEFREELNNHFEAWQTKQASGCTSGLTSSGHKRRVSHLLAEENQYRLMKFFSSRKSRIIHQNRSSAEKKDKVMEKSDILRPRLQGSDYFIWNPVYNNFRLKYLKGRAHKLQLRKQ